MQLIPPSELATKPVARPVRLQSFRVGAISGLGMAYAGSAREDIAADIVPALTDAKSNMEVMGAAALALGQIFVGTCDGQQITHYNITPLDQNGANHRDLRCGLHPSLPRGCWAQNTPRTQDTEVNPPPIPCTIGFPGGITENIINMLVDRSPEELETPHARYIVLGLGLIFLGRQQAAEVAVEAMVVLPEAFQKFAKMLLDCCAYVESFVINTSGLPLSCGVVRTMQYV